MTDRQLLELLLEKVTNIESDQNTMKADMQTFRVEQKRHGDLLHQLIQIVGTTNAKVDDLATEMREGFERVETDISILLKRT